MAYNLYLIEYMNADYEYVLWKDIQDVLWWRWSIRKIIRNRMNFCLSELNNI